VATLDASRAGTGRAEHRSPFVNVTVILGRVSRIDSASRIVHARPVDVFAAMVKPDALVRWLPPQGMTGTFEHADISTGGSYRLVLTYDEKSSRGKSTPGSDVVEVRFLEVVPNERIVQAIDFVSEDPAFHGTMIMTWQFAGTGDGTHVQVRAEDVPPGISPEDHVAGMTSSLANLAKYVEEVSAQR
jgi:uncharacterized protein YndB with AHSA1/START domain